MAVGELYIVYIERLRETSYEDVQKKMDLARSWYRINESVWVLYTTSDADKWYARLSPLVKDTGSLFICKLDYTESQGLMSQKFWDWVKKHKGESV
jgi:hypothetical protein